MTKHSLLGLTGILAAILEIVSAQSPAGTGHWEGAIQVPGQEIAIQVDLVAKANEKWEGTITIPSQNLKALPLSDVVVQGNAVSFSMKGVPGDPKFKGTISEDGKSIAGDLSQGGATIPFTLAWKGVAKIDEAPKSTSISKDLEGSWEGALDVNGTVLRLTLKLSNQESGATGTVVSVDQGGSEIPLSSITQASSHLKLTLSVIGASYEGDLREGQIAGTWTQGSGSWPLVFKRPQK